MVPVVVSTSGNTTSAVFGELMCHTAAAKRLGGIIVDGAIRDVEGISALGFPAYSRAVCPGGCDKDGPGEINVPISCGNTVVMPGDIVVGVRVFDQRVDNQLVTVFGVGLADAAESPSGIGHYEVGSAGGYDARGWGVTSARSSRRARASAACSGASSQKSVSRL